MMLRVKVNFLLSVDISSTYLIFLYVSGIFCILCILPQAVLCARLCLTLVSFGFIFCTFYPLDIPNLASSVQPSVGKGGVTPGRLKYGNF